MKKLNKKIQKHIAGTLAATLMISQVPPTVLATNLLIAHEYENSQDTVVETVDTGAFNQLSQTKLNFKIDLGNGAFLDNYSISILDYISFNESPDGNDPIAPITIKTELPVEISMASDVASPQRIVIDENVSAKITLNDVTFERASSSQTGNHYDKSIIDLSNGASLDLTVKGENTLVVKSFGGSAPTINGVSDITLLGSGKLSIYVPKEDNTDYSSLSNATILKLEDSLAFDGAKAFQVFDNDGVETEDYFAEDFEFNASTKVLTIKSNKKIVMNSSAQVSKIIVEEGIEGVPTLSTSLSMSIPSSASAVMEINSDINLELNNNITMSSCSVANTPTISGKGTMYFTGSGTLTVQTNAEITTPYEETRTGQFVVDMLVNLLSNNYVIRVLDSANFKEEDIVRSTYVESNRTIEKITIKTSAPIEISMAPTYSYNSSYSTGSEFHFEETSNGQPIDVTFNKVEIMQTAIGHALNFNTETNLTLVGKSTVEIPTNFKWSSYKPSTPNDVNYMLVGNTENMTILGSGHMDLLSNSYIHADEDLVDEVTNYKNFSNAVADAVIRGDSTGSVSVYERADIESIKSYLNLTILDQTSTPNYDESYITTNDVSYTNNILYIKSKELFKFTNVSTSATLPFQIIIEVDEDSDYIGTQGMPLIYFETLNIGNVNSNPGMIINSKASLRIISGHTNLLKQDMNLHIPVVQANADVQVVSNGGNFTGYVNEGSSLFEFSEGFEIDETLISSAGVLNLMIYSQDEDVLKSGFMISKYNTNNSLKTNYNMLYEIAQTGFLDEHLVYHEDSDVGNYLDASEKGNSLEIYSTSSVYITTVRDGVTVTDDQLIINSSENGLATMYFNTVNINTEANDTNRPLLWIKGNTKIITVNSTSNTLKPPYNSSNLDEVPTVLVEEDASFNIVKNSGSTLTIYTRPNALGISGGYTQSGSGTMILQEVLISATENDILKDGDITFDGTNLYVNTATPVTIKNRDYNSLLSIQIIVHSRLLSTDIVPNITLGGINLTGGTGSPIQLQSSANIYLSGQNKISGLSQATVGSIRVGQDGTTGVVAKFYAESDTTDVLNVTSRSTGAAIEVTKGHTVEIHGGLYNLEASAYAAAIGASRYESKNSVGDIYLYGGVLSASTSATSNIILGGYEQGGKIVIDGGTFKSKTNITSIGYNSLASVSASAKTANTFDLLNGSRMNTYVQNASVSNYSNAHYNVLEISDNSVEAQSRWTGIRGRVATSYDTQTPNEKEGLFMIYGENVLSSDLVINPNEKYEFFTDNILLAGAIYTGDKDGIRDEAFEDINFSSLKTSDGVQIINNGTIILPGYSEVNPHLQVAMSGDGKIEVPLSSTLIQQIKTHTSADYGYRGDSIFDYFTIKQNDQSLIGVVDIELYKKDEDGKWVLQSGNDQYRISEAGDYYINISAKPTSVADVDDISGAMQVVYTGSAYSSEFRIVATDLEDTSLSQNEILYTGEEISEETIYNNVQVYITEGGLKLSPSTENGRTPDYVSTLTGNFENANDKAVQMYIASTDDTTPIYENYTTFDIAISRRSIKDMLVNFGTVENVVYDGTNEEALVPEITFNYSSTPKKLVEGTDFTVSYKCENETSKIGNATLTIEGIGNFKDEKSFDYTIQGDLSVASLTTKNLTDDGKVSVSLAGTINPDNIEVTFDGNTLINGTDYYLESEIILDKIKVTAIGINNYVNAITSNELEFALDVDTVKAIDPTTIYFKPDNTIDPETVPILVKVADSGDDTDYVELTYGDHYELDLDFNSYGDKAMAKVTLTIDPDELVKLGITSLLTSKIETTFELFAVQAGAGTGTDVSKAIIYAVDTVYERPDGNLYLEDDLILEVDNGSRKQLVKDTDYTITSKVISSGIATNDIYEVVVTGIGTYADSKVTFNVKTGTAGTGTGSDISKGIIDKVQAVAVPGVYPIKEEIPQYIELIVDGMKLELGVHFEIDENDIEVTTHEDGSIASDIAHVTVKSLAGITGDTKRFEIRLTSKNDYVSSKNLFVKPDYTIDSNDIILYDPLSHEQELIKGFDYTDIDEIWSTYDSDPDAPLEFKGIIVAYSEKFGLDNGLTPDADGVYKQMFSVYPNDAGTGDTVRYGLINIAESVVKRPDGRLYSADINLDIHADKHNSFDIGSDYEVVSVIEKTGDKHPSNDSSIPTTTHEIHVNGLGDYAGSSLTFGIVALEPGSGTGTDISKGIIDLTGAVYKRPDNTLHINDDLVVTVDEIQLVNGTDIIITNENNVVTVTGIGSYDGSTSYQIVTGEAGTNSSGTKNLANGIIYPVATLYTDEDGNIDVTEKLGVYVNTGEANRASTKLTLNTDYTVTFDEATSSVTVTGVGDYYGTITYKVVIEDRTVTRIPITAEALIIEPVYIRPDGDYYINEDIFVYLDVTDSETDKSATILLEQNRDYLLYSNYTHLVLEGINDYEGMIMVEVYVDIAPINLDVATLEIRNAGTGTGTDISKGILHLVEPVMLREDGLNLSDLKLEYNLNGTKTLLDQQYYDVAYADTDIETGQNIVKVTANNTASDFSGEITFKIKTIPYVAPEVSVPDDEDEKDPETPNDDEEENSGSNNNGNNNGNNSGNNNTDDTDDTDETAPETESDTDGGEWINPFIDVYDNDWFYEAVKYNYINEVMTGTSSNTFEPHSSTTRAMIIQIIYNMQNQPETIFQGVFVDVNPNEWYADAISWGYLNQVIKGISETEYAPNEFVTREQLAVMLHRYTGINEIVYGDLTVFNDYEDSSAYAIDALQWAVATGLLQGDDKGNLNPTAQATRAEVATIMVRFLNK